MDLTSDSILITHSLQIQASFGLTKETQCFVYKVTNLCLLLEKSLKTSPKLFN